MSVCFCFCITRVALALEEAAAAIAVDGTWPKGYYFKALALEELGEYAKALAACEEGLHIHRCVRPAAETEAENAPDLCGVAVKTTGLVCQIDISR
jgi:hypothetical protein